LSAVTGSAFRRTPERIQIRNFPQGRLRPVAGPV
jgi:hypothetical protein